MKKIIISLGVVCSGLLFVSAQSVFPHRPPASPSNIILSAPVSTATSSSNSINYKIKWTDNARNESGYYVSLYEYPTGSYITGVYVGANTTSTNILFYPSTGARYAVVTASNDFGSNGTSSNILYGTISSYIKSVFSLRR
jgi:hypothetical protein